jgi:dipeptidyl aminopeptidase/acylaminoacyl peptidase
MSAAIRWWGRCLGLVSLAVAFSCGTVEAGDKRPMTVEDLWKVKRVGPPTVSPDGTWAAVEVSTYALDADEPTSDIWLLACDGSRQVQLTRLGGKNSGPKWSPDGRHIAFLSKREGDDTPQIYLIAPDGGEARRLTKMPMAPGHLKWSADSKTLYCIAWTWPDADDQTHLQREKQLKESKSKAYIIDDAAYRYWDKWIADGKRPMIFAVDVATGAHRNLLQGTGHTLPPYEPSANDYDVSPDGKELAFVADSVKEIGTDVNYDIYTLDLSSGKVRLVTADNPANDTNPVYSPDGRYLAFLRQTIKFFYADRSRLMVQDRSSGAVCEVSAGLDRSCANPRWLPDSRHLYVEVEDQGYVNLFLASVEPPRVTPHYAKVSERSVDVAARGDVAVWLRSSFDLPAAVYAGTRQRQKAVSIDRFNDALVGQWKLGRVESVTFAGADDRPVQMWIVYPPDFDAGKKWPLVQMVHGGPHNGVYSDFSYRWNPQLWAAQGWVIGIVNFHGSSGFGQEFTDSITGDLGTKPMIDILRATDWFEQQPWIDRQRVAAAGASYGGYMMAWLNGHTDRFRAMVCHAGVYNWHSMMASDLVRSRERALGAKPWGGDLEKIDRQTAQRYAAHFQTPTLILHGEKDYRVPVTQGMEYYNTLRQKGVPTRFVYFPDENHWILKAPNSLVWHREVFGWLKKYIGAGPAPAAEAGP